MSVSGQEFIERILRYRPANTESDFLNAVSRLPFDGHDAAGMIYIARQGLSEVSPDDDFYPILEKVAEFSNTGKKYDKFDAKGIIHICEEALADQPAPAARF